MTLNITNSIKDALSKYNSNMLLIILLQIKINKLLTNIQLTESIQTIILDTINNLTKYKNKIIDSNMSLFPQ